MRQYVVVIEQKSNGFFAYSPEVPGCSLRSRAKEGVVNGMRDMIARRRGHSGTGTASRSLGHTSLDYVEIPA